MSASTSASVGDGGDPVAEAIEAGLVQSFEGEAVGSDDPSSRDQMQMLMLLRADDARALGGGRSAGAMRPARRGAAGERTSRLEEKIRLIAPIARDIRQQR